MKAEESTISQILTDQIVYSIPPYQRPYSWERENVRQLLEDLWDAYESQEQEYFIGSIITIEKAKNKHYDVVDGQQRLTTLNLILARLRDHIEDDAAKAELGKRVRPRNPLSGATESPRLLLRKTDQDFFRRYVLDAQPLPPRTVLEQCAAPQRRIAENITEIDGFFAHKDQQTLKLFANALLSQVYVVRVTTENWQSAYRLFNVLNARGMPLNNSDLIKNALFDKLGSQAARSAELEDRWLELEDLIGIESLDKFLGHYRVLRVPARPDFSLHEEFEKKVIGTHNDPFVVLDALIDAARHYARIGDTAGFSDVLTQQALRALQRVQYDDWIPALLAYLLKPVAGLDEREFVELLEKITMQNWVRRLGGTARQTVYFRLIVAINNAKPAQEVREIFGASANQPEFLDLLSGEIYGKPFDLAVLLRLEEAAVDNSVTKTFNHRISIEHVLPQRAKDPYWTQHFDENQHAHWRHRLGNLTLLAGNRNHKAQGFDFDRKKSVYQNRQQNSSFDLLREICAVPDWTVDSLKARQSRLIELAKKIWLIETEGQHGHAQTAPLGHRRIPQDR